MIRVQVATGQLATGELRLSGPEHHYLMRVRRARVGEAVELFDGAGASAASVIAAIDGETTTLRVDEVRAAALDRATLAAAIPLIKGERMDQCVEKLVEVGCDRLLLWEAERSVVRLEVNKRGARLERIRAQIAAAVRQCGRSTIPTVEGIWTLAELIEQTAGVAARRIALVPGAQRLMPSTTGGSGTGSGSGTVLMISGPEGGFAPGELAALDAAGFERASLTSTVLRAETAPVLGIAIWRWAEG